MIIRVLRLRRIRRGGKGARINNVLDFRFRILELKIIIPDQKSKIKNVHALESLPAGRQARIL
jgi:hypothetical protein